MPDPKTDIDYGRLESQLGSISPRPRPRSNAPSVDDIRAAIGRQAQVDDEPEGAPVEQDPAEQDPNFLDFADRWLAENPNATGDELVPTEVDRQLAEELPGLDLTEYARDKLSNLPPEIQEIIDRATHTAQVEELPEDARAFEDTDVWDDIVRRVRESDQPAECPECGGDQPTVLGPLGQKLMLRCQHCGHDYPLDIPPADEDVEETADLGLPPELESQAKDNSNRFIHIGQELPGPDAPAGEWYGMGPQISGDDDDINRAVELAIRLRSMPEDLGQRAPLVAEILEILRRNGIPEDAYADVMAAAERMTAEPQMDLVASDLSTRLARYSGVHDPDLDAALATDGPLGSGSRIRRAHHVRAQFEGDPFGDEISDDELAELRRVEDEERQRRWQERLESMTPEERAFFEETGMTFEEAAAQQQAEIDAELGSGDWVSGFRHLGDEERDVEDRMGLESFEDAMDRAYGPRHREASSSNRLVRLAAHDSVEVDEIPPCDLCKEQGRDVPAVVDGRTNLRGPDRPGPWANMCEDHFREHGVGLGLGRGQRLVQRKHRPERSPQITVGDLLGIPWEDQGGDTEASSHPRFTRLAQSGYRIVQVDDRQLVIERDGRTEVLRRTDQPIPGSITVGGNTYATGGNTPVRLAQEDDREWFVQQRSSMLDGVEAELAIARQAIDRGLESHALNAISNARDTLAAIARHFGPGDPIRTSPTQLPPEEVEAEAADRERSIRLAGTLESLFELLSPRRRRMRSRLRTMTPKHAPPGPDAEPEPTALEMIRQRLESGRLDPHSKRHLPVKVRDLNSI